MQIRRTANAGVLLTLDDVSILLDGVCQVYPPYLAPPPAVVEDLTAYPPDALAFTHAHPDHFETGFASQFYRRTGRPVLGTAGVAELLPDIPVEQGSAVIGGVRVTPIPSRHLGVEWRNYPHVSYLVEGSRRVFFVGDATPACWKESVFRMQPDVLIAPYPYVTTRIGWQSVERFTSKAVVVVHMPAVDNDPDGIWSMVKRGLDTHRDIPVYVPDLGETVFLFDPFFPDQNEMHRSPLCFSGRGSMRFGVTLGCIRTCGDGVIFPAFNDCAEGVHRNEGLAEQSGSLVECSYEKVNRVVWEYCSPGRRMELGK